MLEKINLSQPNDGLGDLLRNGGLVINNNYDQIDTMFNGKADTIHTHTISQIDGLDDQINGIDSNINDLQGQINDKAGLDAYDKINDLNDLIADLNTMIQTQNQEIIALNDLINQILQN